MTPPTDDAPAFIPLDNGLERAVEGATRALLDALADESREAGLDGAPRAALLSLTSDVLAGYIKGVVPVGEDEDPMKRAVLSSLVARKTLSLLLAQAGLDIALEGFLKGKGVLDASAFYVNDPAVMAVVEAHDLPDGEAMLVPVADFYPPDMFEGDDRRDMLAGVVRWNGVYLCRPALVDFAEIEDLMTAADAYAVLAKTANVAYQPRFGAH